MGDVMDEEVQNKNTVCPYCGKQIKVILQTYDIYAEIPSIRSKKGEAHKTRFDVSMRKRV